VIERQAQLAAAGLLVPLPEEGDAPLETRLPDVQGVRQLAQHQGGGFQRPLGRR
jgi:hypothetical protein